MIFRGPPREHIYRIDLEGVSNWDKLVTTVKFKFDQLNISGDWIKVSKIYFE